MIIGEMFSETKLMSHASAAFASGSVIEGFANKLSDLDIYAITEKHPSFKTCFISDNIKIDIIRLGDLMIDVEYWPLDMITRMIEKIDKLRLKDQTLLEPLKPQEIRFCYRIRIGVPLFNEKLITEVKGMIDFMKLQKWQVARHLRSFDNRVEDTVGALQSDDYEIAFFNARDALESAIDAYLASKGFTNPMKKWRYKELVKIHSPEHEIVRRFWKLEAPLIRKKEDIRRYVEECLEFANDLSLRAQFERGEENDR